MGFDHSTGKDDWMTPAHILDFVREHVGPITVDLAALKGSRVCLDYCGPDREETGWTDGLTWFPLCVPPGLVWANPPYSQEAGGIDAWLHKLWGCTVAGHVAVGLTFARTEHTAWHDVVRLHAADVYLIRGRVSFVDPATGATRHPGPAGSALVVFRPGQSGPPRYHYLRQVRRDEDGRLARSKRYPLRLEAYDA